MKLQLKRSNVLDSGAAKEPTAVQVEYGELCVNYNSSDPTIFIKDSDDNIIRIAGAGSAGEGEVPTGDTNPPDAGDLKPGQLFYNELTGLLYYWNGSEWVAVEGEGFYVNVSGDNMTGNLTLGGDKITLNATDGSITAAGNATFAGNVAIGTNTSHGYPLVVSNDGKEGVEFNCGNNIGGTDINSYDRDTASYVPLRFNAGNVIVHPGGDPNREVKIDGDGITAAGNGTFAGIGIFGGDADDGANPGIRLAPVGAIAACRAAGNTAVFSGYTEGTSTPNISLNADGSSSFKGAIEVDRSQGAETGVIIREAGTARLRLYASGNIQASGTLTCGPYNPGSASAHGATLNVDGTVGTCQVQAADGTATNASAIIVRLGASTAWSVNYGGDAAFRNAFLKLDPDNPDSWQTKEETYEEQITGPLGKIEKTVTKTREVREYIGKTLDVRQTLELLLERAAKQDETIADLTRQITELKGAKS